MTAGLCYHKPRAVRGPYLHRIVEPEAVSLHGFMLLLAQELSLESPISPLVPILYISFAT